MRPVPGKFLATEAHLVLFLTTRLLEHTLLGLLPDQGVWGL